MKIFLPFLLILFASCSVYRMYDGKSKPAGFLADSTVFRSSEISKHPRLSYPDVSFLNGVYLNTVDLLPDEEVTALIAQPTLFVGMGMFLVFPGDKLSISTNSVGDYEMKSLNDSTRTRELQAFSIFNEIAPPSPSLFYRNISVDSIDAIEKKVREDIPQVTKQATHLFDSLCSVYRTSSGFNAVARDYAKAKYRFSLFRIYSNNKEDFVAKGRYRQKCLELLPVFNSLATGSEIESSLVEINEFAQAILGHDISKIATTADVENDFASVETNFKGPLREYLLSRILYAAYTKQIPVADRYLERYKALASTGSYQKILQRVQSDQSFTERTIKTKDNHLYSMKNKEITTVENILSRHKGRVIFLDLMASWCIPCREDLPFLKKMEQEYSKKDIVFINLSFDRQYQPWKKYIYSSKLEKNNSFMFVNAIESPFVSRYRIGAIPRYLIFDKTGALVDSSAPGPKDGKLKMQLDSLVHSRP